MTALYEARAIVPLPYVMFLLTPLQSAAVIAANCLVGKVYVTLRYRYFFANKLLGNLWKKMYILPNTNGIKELQDGHLKQDPQWKLVRATQLNESEWTALCLPLCLYFASNAGLGDTGFACTLMAVGQVVYNVARPTIGYPFHLGGAIARYLGVVLGAKTLWDAAF